MDPVQANDFAKNFRRYREFVEKTGYMPITGDGQPLGAYLSEDEFERYLALRKRETRVAEISDLPPDIIAEIDGVAYSKITR